eukprot:2738786-Amphidinium_carterae.1
MQRVHVEQTSRLVARLLHGSGVAHGLAYFVSTVSAPTEVGHLVAAVIIVVTCPALYFNLLTICVEPKLSYAIPFTNPLNRCLKMMDVQR